MRIAILGDFHYTELNNNLEDKNLLQIKEEYFESLAKEFINITADYHISVGDLTNTGSKQELKRVFEMFKNENGSFIHVIGNHDSYSSSKKEIMEYSKQKRYFSNTVENNKLIFIDSTHETNYETWEGTIDKEQLEWLEKEVKEAGDKTILIFSHHPIYNTTSLSTEKNLYIREIDKVNEILSLHKGRGVFFCGHNHENSIAKRDNWYFVQTAAALDINAARVVEIKEDCIEIFYKKFSSEDVEEKSDLIAEKMNFFTKKLNGAFGKQEDMELKLI